MMMIHRILELNGNMINIHKLHQMEMVTLMFKVQNVKDVGHDVIVNVLEKELWVSLVCC